MNLADEISKAAIASRSNVASLQSIVERWSKIIFWQQDPDTQLKTLLTEVSSNDVFQLDLANALGWDKPRSDSGELTLLAIDAARGKGQFVDPAIFGVDLDWNAWKKQPDLRQLQLVFENNTRVRNDFARAVKAFPGRQHAEEIAIYSFDQWKRSLPKCKAIQEVFDRYLLNWKAFSEGIQDKQFCAAIVRNYEFRDEVARSVSFKSSEAQGLAAIAIDMWKASPTGFSRKVNREQLLSSVDKLPEGPALRGVLGASIDQDQDWNGWRNVEADLTRLFAQNPMTSCALWEAAGWPRPFALVLREELRQVEASRNLKRLGGEVPEPPLATTALDASDLAAHKRLFGIALSGGGIRSATFNLGVLQKLAQIGLLEKVDYLSTVSGGGYIGSWLAAWISKNGNCPYSEFRGKLKDLLAPGCPDPRAPGQRPIRFLREFSNYLTPRLGGFSFDSWTMAAVYSRNVILNQAVLVFFLGTLLLIPRLMGLEPYSRSGSSLAGYVAALALLIGVLCMSLSVRRAVSDSANVLPLSFYTPGQTQLWVVLPILTAVYAASIWLWFDNRSPTRGLSASGKGILWGAFIFSAVLSSLLTTVGGFISQYRSRHSNDRAWLLWMLILILLITTLSAGTSVGLLSLSIIILSRIGASGAGIWHAEVWGPIMLLGALIIPGTLQVGLMGIDYPDAGREWLSRFRAVCSIYATYWILWMCAAIYGPLLILKSVVWTKAGLSVWLPTVTIGWVMTTVASIISGKSSRTGSDKDGNPKFSWLQLVARVGPPVFIAGLLLLIATLENLLLAHGRESSCLNCLIEGYWYLFNPSPMWDRTRWIVDSPGYLLLGLISVGLVLAWRVDINEFSMHHFYKNRLVRCYLGASNENRQPNPFTGFDSRDDLNLSDLLAVVDGGGTPYLGPYPILNTTLNISAGKQLAWQERKGASFTFSPCYCGFDLHGWNLSSGSNGQIKTKSTPFYSGDTLRPVGYRKTHDYSTPGGPLLGTAMSISGAAANPNQGYNTSPAVSFLMTMFDVRLGWWLGNPRRDVCSGLSSPRFGLLALLSELVGSTDDETRFVNLSDGGHFDNMGLYELVRRRCSFIIVCDAEQDLDYAFGGLGAAIRKCRVDFGALIEIDPSRIRPMEKGKPSASHCTVGTIQYLDGSEGTLLYIKTSLTGDEPEDVTQYHAVQRDFPHETTADQWFTESQFESYRALGFHATYHSLNPAKAWINWDEDHPDVPRFFEALKNYWYPVNPHLKDSASKHTSNLSEILERIRKNPALHPLGADLFPGAFTTASGPRPVTEEFYFSMCIIQLMEDLYFDFQLDHHKWFNDPRIGGWRYLFERWKKVPSVSSAWAAERDTFRKDFQLFWNSL